MCFGNTLRPHPGAKNLDFPFKLGMERSTSGSPDCVGRCSRTGGRPGRPTRTPTSTRATRRAGCRGAERSEGEGGVDLGSSTEAREERRPRGGPGGGMRAGGGGRPPARAGGGAPGSQRSRAAAGFGDGRVRRARARKEGAEKRQIRMNERGGKAGAAEEGAGAPRRCSRNAGGGRRGGPTAPGHEEAPHRRGPRRPRLSAKMGSKRRRARGVREKRKRSR